MFRDMFSGYAQRIRLENALQLQRAKLTRPQQVKIQVAEALKVIDVRLQDPDLKRIYDSITITLPDDVPSTPPQPASTPQG